MIETLTPEQIAALYEINSRLAIGVIATLSAACREADPEMALAALNMLGRLLARARGILESA